MASGWWLVASQEGVFDGGRRSPETIAAIGQKRGVCFAGIGLPAPEICYDLRGMQAISIQLSA